MPNWWRHAEPIQDPQPKPYDAGLEMTLDGAQVLCLGRDLVVNVAQSNHEQGLDWLQRHLGHDCRVHRVCAHGGQPH
ncbi:hypothetical protein [Streptomyces sp. NPDC002851]